MQKKLLAVLLASLFVSSAWAEDKPINITAQDMPGALHSLASQTGIQLLFTTDELKNIRAKEISGVMSVEEALKRLLEGSNYSFRLTGNGTYVLQRLGAALMLNELTVTATRTERNVDEVPASVSVLTAKKLKTKNRQNVYDALRDFEGLDFVAQRGVGHQVSPQIRGFSDSGKATQVLVDGIALDSVVSQVMGRGGLNFTSLQDVDRVEVVRGPVSALYGPSTLGGVINVIPKRWKGEPGAEVNAAYGSHNTQALGAAAGIAKESFDVRISAYNAKSDGYVATPVQNSSGQWDLGARPWEDKKYGLLMAGRPADNHDDIWLSTIRYSGC
ncbi:MAG: TonB-dependent receptor plug domain-containing protein [Sideroxydans sp.]|nr:TonB-dependent receptor plug domain-containing protein [Sideroxydans sp.]